MYTPLYVKSNYSFLSSLVKIEELIDKCIKLNIKSVALLDDDMISTKYFYNKCIEKGIRPIIGIDLEYNGINILLYAKNFEGYKNLIKLNTIKSTDKITREDLINHNRELICIVPFNHKESYLELKKIYENIYLGYGNKEEEYASLKISSRIVFINKVLYLNKKDNKYLKYALMIRDKKNIMDDIDFVDNYNYLLNEEVLKLSSEEGINTTKFISEQCNVVFPKSKNRIPKFKTNNNITSEDYLTRLSIEGLKKRLNNTVSEEYKDRLLYELNIIKEMGFSDYFLIVYDYIKYAKKKGYLVGPGRGSAGGSLVAYALGIIDVDPIVYGLLFERFLNPGRVTMPDIDVDFPDIYRDDVINYVKEKYGYKNVSGIIAIGTLKAKAVLDDVARVLKINPDKVDRLKKYIDSFNVKLKDVYDKNADFKNIIDNDDRLSLLYEVSIFLEGFPRNTTTHASGIIMGDEELDNIIPLLMQDKVYVSGYEMGYLEELGLLKMDFLGNRNLTIIMDIIDNINKYENKTITFSSIPLDDEKAMEIFYNVDTFGIFQFESDVMKNLLRRLKPRRFDDIIAANALVRPGPMDEEYISVRNEHKTPSYPSAELEKVLKETYGVIIYQEQIMQIANIMAGYNLSEADNLRRAMSKKKKEALLEEEKKFITNSISRGYSELVAKNVYDLILNFAQYGFNKSHTVAYSIISFRQAYLKAHYPKYFYSSLLDMGVGSDNKTSSIIKEARSKRVEFILPEMNISSENYKVTQDGIIFPFSDIKGIGVNIARDIVRIRKDGFTNLFNCLSKLGEIGINRKNLESLIYSSCFRNFGYNIKTLIDNLDSLLTYSFLTKGLDEKSTFIDKPVLDIKEEYQEEILMEKEKELFGFYLSHHPTTKYKLLGKVTDLKDIGKYLDKYTDVICVIDKIRTHVDKNGNTMAFLTASDEAMSIEVIVFSKVYEDFKNINKGDIVLMKVKVEKSGSYQLVVEKVKKLNE